MKLLLSYNTQKETALISHGIRSFGIHCTVVLRFLTQAWQGPLLCSSTVPRTIWTCEAKYHVFAYKNNFGIKTDLIVALTRN